MRGRNPQSGQATIEYIYVLPILLLLLLASLQFVFIYEAKQTLNYATFVGTRAGALKNGSMAAIQDGLAAGLAPLFAHKIGAATELDAVKLGRRTAKTELANPLLAKIEIVNPTPGALAGFGTEIPNDNLMYRDPAITKDGMNVQDANLLKVRVTYCVRLVVPIVKNMIFGYAVATPTAPAKIDSTYSGGTIAAPEMLKVAPPGTASTHPSGLCYDNNPVTNPVFYRIPVTSEAVVRMQTPFRNPGSWTAP
ncbi:MAG: TadE/TadG family type IV pilus assembly protein [Sulfuritalea sp.]|nr:TadE/TadG family type IV pilus assembly protein [Sulfuritalea sp.]